MTEQLKPCKKCGNPPKIWVKYNPYTVKAFGIAECCGETIKAKPVPSWKSSGGGKEKAEEEAIAAWNRRHND